jgi:hypothetical protein
MSSTAEYCLQIVNQLYENMNGFSVSKKDRKMLAQNDSSLIYGEITSQALFELLEIVQPQRSEVFYDLGSGAGKPLLWASILYPWRKCCGIEILPSLYQLSIEQSQKLINHPEISKMLPGQQFNIEFINNNFLNCDFSDANVILVEATAFSYDLWEGLVDKFFTLPAGVRIIILTKKIQSEQFEQIHVGNYMMSWGMNTVNIYRKVA